MKSIMFSIDSGVSKGRPVPCILVNLMILEKFDAWLSEPPHEPCQPLSLVQKALVGDAKIDADPRCVLFMGTGEPLPEDFKHFLVPGMVANLSTGVDRASIDCCRDAAGVQRNHPLSYVALMVVYSGVASYRKS